METLRDNPTPVKQDPAEATLRADPEKGRRRDRLELAGGENLQSIARVSAVAGRLQLLSRADVSHLEIARRRAKRCSGEPGRMSPMKKRLLIGCGERTTLELIEVQVEGRKRMPAEAFLNGHHLKRRRNTGSEGGVKLPLGYRYSAVYAGIRKVKKDDLALIVPDVPASAAAVFTQNRVQAAPVRIARWNLTKSRGLVSAVLVNAGNANCATRTGDRVALACCDAVAQSASRAADAGVSRVHRRDRRRAGRASDRERAARSGRGTRAQPLRRRGARHPHHRSVMKTAHSRCASRKARSRSRG